MDKNKTNKDLKRTLITNIIIGLFIIGLGIFFFIKILEMEQGGGTLSLPRIAWLLYDIVGAYGVLGGFVVLGGYYIFRGYSAYKENTKTE